VHQKNHEILTLTLKTGTIVSQLTDSVQGQIYDFFSNGVVTTGEVVRGIFLTGNKLFGVEQLSVGAGSDFVDDGRFLTIMMTLL
jgi:hypothetical protein